MLMATFSRCTVVSEPLRERESTSVSGIRSDSISNITMEGTKIDYLHVIYKIIFHESIDINGFIPVYDVYYFKYAQTIL